MLLRKIELSASAGWEHARETLHSCLSVGGDSEKEGSVYLMGRMEKRQALEAD